MNRISASVLVVIMVVASGCMSIGKRGYAPIATYTEVLNLLRTENMLGLTVDDLKQRLGEPSRSVTNVVRRPNAQFHDYKVGANTLHFETTNGRVTLQQMVAEHLSETEMAAVEDEIVGDLYERYGSPEVTPQNSYIRRDWPNTTFYSRPDQLLLTYRSDDHDAN